MSNARCLTLSEFDGKPEERLRQVSQDDTVTRLELVDLPAFNPRLWDAIGCLLNQRSFESVKVERCTGPYLLDEWGKTTKRLTLQLVQIRPTLVLGAHLQELSLISVSLSEEVASSLGEQLRSHSTIETLDLTESRFCGDGLSILSSQGLEFNTSLKSICLSECNLMDEQLAEIVRSLHHHPKISELDISFNKCRSSGMHALVYLLQNSTKLSKLAMGFQAFGEAKRIDLTSFTAALATNSFLKDLELGGNSLRDKDLPNLVSALCQNNTLAKLDLAENRFSNQGIAMLAERFGDLTQLRHLVLEDNRFDEEGLSMLVDALSSNNNIVLEEMEVDSGLMRSKAWRQLSYHLDINWGGRRLLLLLQENNVPLSLWPTILARANDPKKHGLTIRVPVAADIIYCLLRGPALLQR